MAVTGQTGTQAPQSMHSAGLMKSCFTPSYSGSSLRGWMQSTGQTSTHAVSFVPMQGSAITYAIQGLLCWTQDRWLFHPSARPPEISLYHGPVEANNQCTDCTCRQRLSQLRSVRLEWIRKEHS